jgi:hypothetical protein
MLAWRRRDCARTRRVADGWSVAAIGWNCDVRIALVWHSVWGRPAISAAGSPPQLIVRRAAAWLLLAGIFFLGLREIASLRPHPVDASMTARTVFVVGVTDRQQLTPLDMDVLDSYSASVQFGAVSTRARYIGDCAAAGWTTLGAGRSASVGGLCDPQVRQQRVVDWPARVAAAAAHHGDAHLGTLASAIPSCIAAVGPGAALTAARPDGTLASYETVEQFLAGGLAPHCAITMIDAQGWANQIIASLVGRPHTLVIVTGIGHSPGSNDAHLQAIYVAGVTPAGWLTSRSTRRDGVVNLTDLSATLIHTANIRSQQHTTALDGNWFQARADRMTAAAAQHHLAAISALSDAAGRADLILVAAAGVLLGALIGSIRARRFRAAYWLAAAATMLPVAMALAGALPWYETYWPTFALCLVVVGWCTALTVVGMAVGERLSMSIGVVAAAFTAVFFTVDAALGAVMQPGSMFNSKPTNGGRWYGFGNVTFAVYAAATLVLMGYLAQRLDAASRRPAVMITMGIVGIGAIACDGWPSMGADFGGVLALTPAVVWLLCALSGIEIRWRGILVCGVLAVTLVAFISWLDWRRGPGAWSHLGNFVQRILNGDALDIISRKAAAAQDSLLSPLGLVAVIAGTVLWILIFRVLGPLFDNRETTRAVAIGILVVAVVGTLVNDGGVSIWTTITIAFTVTLAGSWIERISRQHRSLDNRTVSSPRH